MARPAPTAKFIRLLRPSQSRYYSAPLDEGSPGTAHAAVKPSNIRSDDIALFYSDKPCSAAAVFTQNRFQAAPVTVTREILRESSGKGIKGVVVNAGCANAVTGREGLDDARAMAQAADGLLKSEEVGPEDSDGARTLVMSTGVIGQRLPMDRILSAIPSATKAFGSTHDHFLAGARAICTTDTFPKLSSQTFSLPSYPRTTFSLAGTAKGAGMIHPNMATLLSILMTDAPVAPLALQTILTRAIAPSFNSISVDGDTSTNDTVVLLANGAAATGSPLYKRSPAVITDPDSEDGQAFQAAVTSMATQLAQLVVRDGEGATKFVTIRVRGGQERSIRHRIASSVARSPLVKTALYGRDANWGRILCAIGYCDGLPDASVDPSLVGVSFVGQGKAGAELRLLVNGEPIAGGVDEAAAGKLLAEEDLEILIRLDGAGSEGSGDDVLFWTCDLSHEYVTINGDYRT